MKHLIITGLLASLSFAGFSQEKIEYVEYDLANGIHVILHEEHATPIVAVSVLYHVGSKNENQIVQDSLIFSSIFCLKELQILTEENTANWWRKTVEH